MAQLPLPVPVSREELEQAVRNLFSSWGQLQVWAKCGPGCVWCQSGVPTSYRERHQAARRLWAMVAP